MAVARCSEGQGWHDAQVRARAPFQIDPAAAVLYDAQEIVEGMKAYRGADGQIALQTRRERTPLRPLGRAPDHARAARGLVS
jgi:hypothetical protein